MSRIHQTTNYDLFHFASGNRIINQNNVSKALLESIKEKNMLSSHPILCDREMQVIDGQNRLVIARILGVPIYYVIDETVTIEDIPRCQVQTPWDIKHYLGYYKNQKKEYMFVDEICLKYKFYQYLPFVVNACSSVSDATRSFRKGKMKITKNISKLEENFKNIAEIRDYIQKICSSFHISAIGLKALWIVVNDSKYKHSIMMNKIEKYIDKAIEAFKFKSRDNIVDHFIEHVYNRFTKSDEKLRCE